MKKIFFLLFVSAAWIACDDDDSGYTPDNRIDDRNDIQVSAVIANAEPVLKTAYTGSTAAWKDGDVLGLFCAQTAVSPAVNVQYSVTGTASTPVWTATPTIYWADGTTAHKFVAYAPYVSGNTSSTAVKLPALTPQTGTINPAQDFLYSKNLWTSGVTRSGGAVGLIFTHALSLIEFDITINSSIAANTTLTSFTLTAGGSDKVFTSDATSSTIDITSGTITAGTVVGTLTITPSTAPVLSSTAKAVYALILPGTFTAPTLTINLNEAGTTAITVPAVSIGTTTFAPGSKYTYAVAISRTAITISNPTITDWTTVNGSGINPSL